MSKQILFANQALCRQAIDSSRKLIEKHKSQRLQNDLALDKAKDNLTKALIYHKLAQTEERQQRKKYLQEIKKLEEEKALKDQFVYGLVHDLRTPLCSIQLYTALIQRKFPDVPKAYTSAILRSLTEADHLINNVLDIKHVNSGCAFPISTSQVDLKELVIKTLADYSQTHDQTINFKCLLADCMLELDALAIKRILENLLNNALKYGDKSRVIEVSLKQTAQEIILKVHNWGKAIPAKDKRAVFKLFTRSSNADTSASGWGVGLAIVKGLTEAHGGRVKVYSKEETGTAFKVYLKK